jgi:hypothetical protein
MRSHLPVSRNDKGKLNMNPVSQGLPGHAVRCRRRLAGMAFNDQSKCQQAAHDRPVADLRRESAKFDGVCSVRAISTDWAM